jgi:hypothetical protein
LRPAGVNVLYVVELRGAAGRWNQAVPRPHDRVCQDMGRVGSGLQFVVGKHGSVSADFQSENGATE